MSAAYRAVGDGGYPKTSGRPKCCAKAVGGALGSCWIIRNGYRRRKAGPELRLQVVRCTEHNSYMTVYAPGFVPYARVAVAPVDLEGRGLELENSGEEPVQLEGSEAEPPAVPDSLSSGKTRLWEATVASAAADAASKRIWIREPLAGDPPGPRYATQARWIQAMALLLGLAPSLGERVVETILEHLELGAVAHWARRAAFVAAKTLRQRGVLIMETLGEVRVDDGLWMRILAAGYLAGKWGRPGWWVASLGREVSPLSRVGRNLRGPP